MRKYMVGALLNIDCHIPGCYQKCDTPEGQSLTFRSELMNIIKMWSQKEYLICKNKYEWSMYKYWVKD